MTNSQRSLPATVRRIAHPLTDGPGDYDPLIERVGGARVVMLGEATHGTHEFYRERARITRRLIRERGFNAVAVEADWPDAYRVNRWVRGRDEDEDADAALSGFRRFPTWMWRNREVLAFVEWLREYNDARGAAEGRVGFYGLDLYSLFSSIDAVLGYLDRVDPDAAARARYRYACFEHYGEDARAYGYAAGFDLDRSCEDEVVGELVDVRRHAAELARRDGRLREEAAFDAEQNARVVKDAEKYYRSMFRGRTRSWNLRDGHMVDTLGALLDRLGPDGRVVVWAHNSHVGDARATDVSDHGQQNIGQLARERYGERAVLVGFTTYAGSVTAAAGWGAPAERMRVRPSLEDSCGALFHSVERPRFLLITGDEVPAGFRALREPRLQRAIGVVYLPESERVSHYFTARPADQFDAIIHIDETRAVEPLERTSEWEAGEVPETFPAGL